MTGNDLLPASFGGYEFEVEIQADSDRVWHALVNETNEWWVPDFRMVGPSSRVTFDLTAGGSGLKESLEDVGSLQWYSVQWCQLPDKLIYMVGHLAPDWGGPAITHFKLKVDTNGEAGCTLLVSDHHLGRVTAKGLSTLQEGWTGLFTNGLKKYVESQ